MSQITALESTMDEAESIVASRGHGVHVTATEFQIHANALDQKLEAVLEVGLPKQDAVVTISKKLAKTLEEMRVEVTHHAFTFILLHICTTSHPKSGCATFKE